MARAVENEKWRLSDKRTFRRKAGEALHPEREGLATLAEIEATQGSRVFQAQYQQTPAPAARSTARPCFLNTRRKRLQTNSRSSCQSSVVFFAHRTCRESRGQRARQGREGRHILAIRAPLTGSLTFATTAAEISERHPPLTQTVLFYHDQLLRLPLESPSDPAESTNVVSQLNGRPYGERCPRPLGGPDLFRRTRVRILSPTIPGPRRLW